MLEFLRHILGICGDHWHPNIFTLLLGITGIYGSVYYVYFKYFRK